MKMNRIFKRKLYDRLLQWKTRRNGKTAILIEGARRVGKSTLVCEFAEKEYSSYIRDAGTPKGLEDYNDKIL